MRLETTPGRNGTAGVKANGPPATAPAVAPASDARRHELIRRAEEMLGAKVVQMDEGFGAPTAGPAEDDGPTDTEE